MDKLLKALIAEAIKGNTWMKFSKPSVSRGKTAYPKTQAELERYGIRFDYDMVVEKDGQKYHMFKMQANQGKIPSSIKAWREKHGTDAVMATVWVKEDATMEEVEQALQDARKAFKAS